MTRGQKCGTVFASLVAFLMWVYGVDFFTRGPDTTENLCWVIAAYIIGAIWGALTE